VRYERVGTGVGAKMNGLFIKWSLLQCGVGEHKKYIVGAQVRDKREHSETILLFFARARGLTLYIFFFINNRV
jgi:hypothetical protein